MKSKTSPLIILTILFTFVLIWRVVNVLAQEEDPQIPQETQEQAGTAFTYQGFLTDAGSPANGIYSLEFTLYNNNDEQVGNEINILYKTITNGLFTVELDFGSNIFTGERLFLEIAVQPDEGCVPWTVLSPRQELTPAPYALALPGLWIQQKTTSPNLIGGYIGNYVWPDVIGATIGGGGEYLYENWVTDNYGTVAGGMNNQAGDNFGTVKDAFGATVGGGASNIAGDEYATIAGGVANTVSRYGAIAGGSNNTASDHSAVGGGLGNDATGTHATIAGGYNNTASGHGAFVGGGGTSFSLWYGNHASGDGSAIAGGLGNIASGPGSFVGGGGYDGVKLGRNKATGGASTIAGGLDNIITHSHTQCYSTIGGGYSNVIDGFSSTISGGNDNTVDMDYATVAGGAFNTISGGYSSTIGGGMYNTAGGEGATVPGGEENSATGNFSFASGQHAVANENGCFVWGDSSTDVDITCDVEDRWVARASGGVFFYTNPTPTSGAYLLSGGSAWNMVSNREQKENFKVVDTQVLLSRIAETPITTWNYKTQDPSIRHVGPMADDFNALIEGLGGEGESYINALDADGISFAAIQGLIAQNQALAEENATLQHQMDDLLGRVEALESDSPKPTRFELLPGMGILLASFGLVFLNQKRGGR